MARIILGVLMLTVIFTTSSYSITDSDFVGAKGKLLFVYKSLENNAMQLTMDFEKEGDGMSPTEQTIFHIVRGDLEIGMIVVKDILGFYTLQAVQISTPSEAKKLLSDVSLDSIDSLNGILQRLEERGNVSNNNRIKQIVFESIAHIEEAKIAIDTLKEFLNN